MHEVLVNRLGGLSLPRKSAVRLTDRPDMTLDVYRRRKTTNQQQIRPLRKGTCAKVQSLKVQLYLKSVDIVGVGIYVSFCGEIIGPSFFQN